MGAAISLPFLSFFALPALTSYSTSLNLLFFTLNWYILLLTHPPLSVEIIGITLVQLLLYIIPSLLFLGFDVGVPSIAGSIKTQGDRSLAGRLGGQRIGKIVGVSVGNVLLGIVVQGGLEWGVMTLTGGKRSVLSLSKTMPMPWSIAKTVIVLLVARGTLQYYIHRFLLHNPRSLLSKLHLQWAHSLSLPLPLTATYDHPLCYLLHNWVPLFLPAILLRAHILPVLFALALASLENTVTYSGYSVLPSGILLPGMAKRVENHYLVRGEGNYSAVGILDWGHGTNVGRDVVDDFKAELDKHDGDAKLAEAGNQAGNFLDGVGGKMRNKAKNGRMRKGSGRS